MSKLVKLALDSLLRQRERTAFTLVGLALAIATVVLVYAISLRFEGNSTDALAYLTGSHNLWVLPVAGVNTANASQFPQAVGRMSNAAVADLRATSGVSAVVPAISAQWTSAGTTLAIYGTGSGTSGQLVLGTQSAGALHASVGSSVTLDGAEFTVAEVDPSLPPTLIQMSFADAAKVTGDASPSWLVADVASARDFAQTATRFTVTSDPAVATGRAGDLGLAYALTGQLSRFDVFSFKTKFGAAVLNKTTGTIFGLVARITLILGFLLAVSSALLTIEERRVEFGILAAVGITDDVLYLFLMESAVIFVTGFLLGAVLGGAAYAALLPALFDAQALIKAFLIVSTYIPAMLVLGALIPLNRLLQQTPLELLRQAA
jgi:putative ABC transport system permease protein